MDRNGSRVATEKLGQQDQKNASQGSLLEEESQEKSKPNPRPATPDSDSKDIKTIYVDSKFFSVFAFSGIIFQFLVPFRISFLAYVSWLVEETVPCKHSIFAPATKMSK